MHTLDDGVRDCEGAVDCAWCRVWYLLRLQEAHDGLPSISMFRCFRCTQTDGATPLYIASQNGHVEVVRALLERGAEVDKADVRG